MKQKDNEIANLYNLDDLQQEIKEGPHLFREKRITNV